MSDLKLAKLPERTPVKRTIMVLPELDQALRDYAAVYRATYGQAESVEELIPFMLTAFLDSDRSFTKARKEVKVEEPAEPLRRRGRRSVSRSASIPSTTNPED
ncbi:MAG: DUF2274 domain-containing protein [Azospirillum sp.]|nr:DUF2274 domain-containing protein [Azospirillum sp.]